MRMLIIMHQETQAFRVRCHATRLLRGKGPGSQHVRTRARPWSFFLAPRRGAAAAAAAAGSRCSGSDPARAGERRRDLDGDTPRCQPHTQTQLLAGAGARAVSHGAGGDRAGPAWPAPGDAQGPGREAQPVQCQPTRPGAAGIGGCGCAGVGRGREKGRGEGLPGPGGGMGRAAW
jgi:hypothetical protein